MSQISEVRQVQEPIVLDKIFLKRENRKVKHDATISFKNQLYEVSPLLIGKTVQIRYDPDKPIDLYIYDAGKEIERAHLCNMSENAKMKRETKKKNDKSAKEIYSSEEKDNTPKKQKTQALKVSFTDVLKTGEENV